MFDGIPEKLGLDKYSLPTLDDPTNPQPPSELDERQQQETFKKWIMRPWMLGGGIDWMRVEQIYVQNPYSVSLAKLAELLDLNLNTLKEHSSRRNWVRRRREFHDQFGEKVIERLAHDQASYIRASMLWYKKFVMQARNALTRAMSQMEIRNWREAVELIERIVEIDKALGVFNPDMLEKVYALEGEVRELPDDYDPAAALEALDRARIKILRDMEDSAKYDPSRRPVQAALQPARTVDGEYTEAVVQ